MDTDKVIQDLNRRFAAPLPEFYQRRIIFWYDEDKEFEDKLDEVVLENAKVVALKDKSLSKFYVAVTRARYSVAFVYKTKHLPSNDIGVKWMPK